MYPGNYPITFFVLFFSAFLCSTFPCSLSICGGPKQCIQVTLPSQCHRGHGDGKRRARERGVVDRGVQEGEECAGLRGRTDS